MQMHVDKGVYRLPAQFTIGGAQLPDSIKAEAHKFVTDFNKSATGATAFFNKKAEGAALELVHNQTLYKTLGQEGYKLSVTANGIRLESATTSGFFYGLTSLKKMLPACIAAGVKDEKVVTYELPLVQITDKPRFPYRGFMLDVARHFFSVQEVKKMLDVMAIYKLNKFHFHLTEDQGWRWEVKKYPRLTSVGAVASNTYVTSMQHGAYWTNRPYGPYYYTRAELKDIVAYAAERHIEVIPEIDMPGHFSAAMAAYPQFSCNPSGPHRVETWGGVFTDVLNVADPKAVRFVKDILDELMDIFPSKNIHIGGDECPTTAWENNKQCQEMYKRLNLTSYRQLQTHFIDEISTYLRSKGRKISVWNETVTEKGADLQLMKKTGATVYCWVPARRGAEIANELGLPSIYTVYGPYYINRAPSKEGWMATLPGNGSDHLKATYEDQPTDFKHSIGVQGTFWTEHVATADVMEHLALPRLIAIAEAGWSPQAKKNFNSFVRRMQADTVMLNYNNYEYDRAFLRDEKPTSMVYPEVSTADNSTYYRIVTRAGDNDRKGRCITLLTADSPLLAQYKAKGAAADRLWTAPQAAEGTAAADAQLWRFEQDSNHPGRFALVSKAAPEGSVATQPTATSVAGRWNYDRTAKHYDFVLGDKGYGTADGYRYYTIRSTANNNLWFNASMPGQGQAVNLYSDPAGGNGGLWLFVGGKKVTDVANPTVQAPASLPKAGQVYLLRNTVDGFKGTMLADKTGATELTHTAQLDNSNNAWELVDASAFNTAGGTFTFRLRNVATGRFVGTPAAKKIERYAFPVSVAQNGATLTATYHPATADYSLSLSGKTLFPIAAESHAYPGVISSGSSTGAPDAVRPQGTGWQFVAARSLTIQCVDTKGNPISTVVRYVPVDERTLVAPQLPGYRLQSALPTLDAGDTPLTLTLTYKKTHNRVFLTAIDEHGALLATDTLAVAVGESLVLHAPAVPFYTVRDFPAEGITLTPETDVHRMLVYTGSAHAGVAAAGEPLAELTDGHYVLLYDTSTSAPERAGYRNVSPENGRVLQVQIGSDGVDPMYVWQLRRNGARWQLFHPATGKYLPELPRSGNVLVGDTPGNFSFTLNADRRSWRVQGMNGEYWDGVVGGMTGWNVYGHAYELRSFRLAPYFRVTVRHRLSADGSTLLPDEQFFAPAGSALTFEAPELAKYKLESVDGLPLGADGLSSDLTLTCNYVTGLSSVRAEAPTAAAHYDLAGRRIAPNAPGLHVLKGSKLIVR